MVSQKQLEADFKKTLKDELEDHFPGCMIIMGNSASRQGMTDWLLLHEDNWAALEVKRDAKAARQPNQPYYVEKLNEMSYAAFVHPDNYHEVIDEIQSAFGLRG